MLSPSRFAYTDKCSIEDTTLKLPPENNVPAIGCKIITEILYQYGYLNLQQIQRLLEHMGHKSIMAKKSLRKMQEQGQVKKYTIGFGEEDVADIDIYMLTPSFRREQEKNEKHKSIHRFDMDNIPYILENLSISQWHIGIMGQYVKAEMYNHRVSVDDEVVTIPSLIRYRTPLGHSIHICGMPMCKGKDKGSLAHFIAKLVLVNNYFMDNPDKYRSYVIVIVCESEAQIEDISKLLKAIRETSGMFLLYTIDTVTNEGNDPLSLLYSVDREDGRADLSIISLRKM